MKIRSVLIKNYKSIKEINIPFKSYSNDKLESHTAFLVGINESGKSAILEAINFIRVGFEGVDYYDKCYLSSQESNEYIDIYADLELENSTFWKEKIRESLIFPNEMIEKLKILKVEKNVYLDHEDYGSKYDIEIEEIPFYEYFVRTTNNQIEGQVIVVEEIGIIKDVNEIAIEITGNNAESFLNENEKLLSKEFLEKKIAGLLEETFNERLPKIQIWKSSPENLINTVIPLSKFKEDPNISLPLKNIFHIYGKTKSEEIKEAIERALKNQARKDELIEKLSDSVTKHINKIWKEHKIKIKVSINGDSCEVFVEDKDRKHSYYRMEQRSEGFKQFISLILSLSALNESHNLNNNIILIDEPEVHLHPSGVRYMRDEILKIGKNNNIFIATHSPYMVDTSCPERHWIVSKEKSETKVIQIGEDTPIEDDTVLASAFGLNLFKELLPKNIIIVEGADDKSVIAHAINLIQSKFTYSIKTAKGASKVYGIAALLNEERISAYFLFDDDKDGRDHKRKILDNLKESFNEDNIFTIRDINPLLPKDSTLEDLMPLNFVRRFFEADLNTTLNLIEDKPFIFQLKQQHETIRSDKQKLDSLKVQLSKKFIVEYNTKQKLEAECSNMLLLVNAFIKKLGDK